MRFSFCVPLPSQPHRMVPAAGFEPDDLLRLMGDALPTELGGYGVEVFMMGFVGALGGNRTALPPD